jgi:hypothetical protein
LAAGLQRFRGRGAGPPLTFETGASIGRQPLRARRRTATNRTMSNTTTMATATIAPVLAAINSSPPFDAPLYHEAGYLPRKTLEILMMPGPMSTMNIDGRMQKIRGNSSFTGTLMAFSSARWRRFTRSSFA